MEDDAKELYNMLWRSQRSSHNPSPNPVTLRRANLAAPGDWVAEKNDGERVNLLFGRTEDTDEEYCFLVRRNRTMVQVNATAAPEGTYDGTLLDGEWMGDRILVFDAVVVAGYSKRKKPFSARLAAARDFLGSVSMEGISVSVKAFVPVREIARLVKDIKAGTKGKCDGLVFMPEKDWVATGRAQNIFKWKPVNLNTIDLRYDGAAWYTSGGFEPYPLSLEGPPPASPGICELRPLGDNQWAVEKPRPDKKAPNHETTVKNTVSTIEEGITMDDILRHCGKK